MKMFNTVEAFLHSTVRSTYWLEAPLTLDETSQTYLLRIQFLPPQCKQGSYKLTNYM